MTSAQHRFMWNDVRRWGRDLGTSVMRFAKRCQASTPYFRSFSLPTLRIRAFWDMTLYCWVVPDVSKDVVPLSSRVRMSSRRMHGNHSPVTGIAQKTWMISNNAVRTSNRAIVFLQRATYLFKHSVYHILPPTWTMGTGSLPGKSSGAWC